MKKETITLLLILAGFTNTYTQSYPEMVTVEGGTFTMGDTEMDGNKIELPTHQVTLKTFKIAKTETTVLQWRVYCDATGTKMPKSPIYGLKDNNPIVNVNYEDVMEYCGWLSKKTGKLYRLPTEAEWEYAARGGNKSKGYKYSGGQKLDLVGWFGDNSSGQENLVGLKTPNELGIYDMSGNVMEWCLDWFGEYKASPETNPKGASTGDGRVLRGGSYNLPATNCRVAARTSNEPDFRFDFAGFRVVLSQ
jgi:formylglycine-generating enzyme required for sulfatase activity